MLDFIESVFQAWHLLKRQVLTQDNILTSVQPWLRWESNPFSVLLWDGDGNVIVDQMLGFVRSLFFPFLLPLLHFPSIFCFLFFWGGLFGVFLVSSSHSLYIPSWLCFLFLFLGTSFSFDAGSTSQSLSFLLCHLTIFFPVHTWLISH